MKLKVEVEEQCSLDDARQEREKEFESVRHELLDKLGYIGMLYQEQFDGIAKRMEKCKSDMWVGIAVFLVVSGLDGIYTIMVCSPGGEILSLAVEIWLAAAFLFIALIKTGRDMCVAVFSYWVQSEQRFVRRYIKKYGIFTLSEERRYCAWRLVEVERLLEELHCLSADMSYRKYAEYEYVERRADTDVMDWFYYHRPLVIGIVATVVFLSALF